MTASITATDPYSFDNGSGGSSDAYGTYAFHCGLHSFMTGSVEVPDPSAHRRAVTVRIAVTPDAGTAFKKAAEVVLGEKS